MYTCSRPEDEDELKEVKRETGKHFLDGSPVIETEKVRRRKFVPFGHYCFSCNTLTQDEDYKALEMEERKLKIIKYSFVPEVIVHGL